MQINSHNLESLDQFEVKDLKYFPIRMACLGLFSSLNVTDDSLSTEYYKNKINKQLSGLKSDQVVIANSKIFTLISKGMLYFFSFKLCLIFICFIYLQDIFLLYNTP